VSDGSKPEGPPSRNRTQKVLQALLARIEARPAALASFLAETPEALVAFGAHRNILYANAQAEALFGYPSGALERQSTDALIPTRLRQPDAPPMRATDDLMYVELPGLMRDGSERIIEWCFGSVRGGGQPIFVMTVRDRVELDRALEALRISEERFQLLVNGVQDHAIFMLDPDGRVSSWNTGASRIKGWTASEILGKPYELFFTPEDRAAGVPGSVIAEALRAGSREVIGWRVRKDGSRFWAHGSLTALRDAQGNVRGFAKITRDLTERRQAEEIERRLIVERAAREAAQEAEQRLRASEDRLRRLQQMTASLSEAATPEDVSAVMLDGCMDTLGAAGVVLYVLATERDQLELLGRRGYPASSFQNYRYIPLDAHLPITAVARNRVPAFYESRGAYVRDYPELREAVAVGDFEATAIMPLVSRGGLVGMLAIRFAHQRPFEAGERTLLLTLSDVCSQALERARLFSAERAARANAESANRSKDEFLAMLGHELRNPLAPIVTAVQLMKRHGDPRSAHERAVIERQTAHLSKLVDDLLDVSRLARGLVGLSRVTVDLADVLSNAVELASPLLEQRAQHLTVSVAKTGLSMNVDPFRVAQVVANLLANAAKYTPPGGNVWLDAEREGPDMVIRIRDDGEGITPELLPNVFNLFVQGAQTVARSGGGLGLGLALVKSFVSLHGGTVTAASDGPGRGSEFVVRLPASPVAAEPATTAAVATPAVEARGKRILVVDDNDDARDLLAEFLQELGNEVKAAADGPAALELLRTFSPEVAILDLGLPVMDGFELARRLRERQPAGASIRLIAVTGYGQDRDMAQSRAAGFDAHLVKPVDIAVLVAALEPKPAAARAPHEGTRPPAEI
jgi:PAS domain S-box-containing protein